MAWAVEQKCESPGQKLVLLMLANHCNGHTKQCNPSHKRLATECSMGISTLKRNIASLADAGLLTIEHRSNEGVSLPNQYRLTPPKLEGVGPNRADGGSKSDGGVGPNRATKQEVEPGIEPFGAAAPLSSAKLPPCPHGLLINLFGQHLPTLPQPKKELWTGSKESATGSRWKFVLTATKKNGDRYASTHEEALAWFDRFFGYVSKSDFLTGRNDKWTRCNLAWLMKADNFSKVLEGHYENENAA